MAKKKQEDSVTGDAVPEPDYQHFWDVLGKADPNGDFRCQNCGMVTYQPDFERRPCDGKLIRQEEPRLANRLPEQIPFEDAIKADPSDWTSRVVYADWLDEHDDPRFAAGIRSVPDWFMIPKREENNLEKYLPADLRTRCIMWNILKDMFPQYKNEDFRKMFATTQLMEGMMFKILALAEQE